MEYIFKSPPISDFSQKVLVTYCHVIVSTKAAVVVYSLCVYTSVTVGLSRAAYHDGGHRRIEVIVIYIFCVSVHYIIILTFLLPFYVYIPLQTNILNSILQRINTIYSIRLERARLCKVCVYIHIMMCLKSCY